MTLEAIDVTHDELVMNGVLVQMKLAKDLLLVQGDRVQLLQVIINLIINDPLRHRPVRIGRGAGETPRCCRLYPNRNSFSRPASHADKAWSITPPT